MGNSSFKPHVDQNKTFKPQAAAVQELGIETTQEPASTFIGGTPDTQAALKHLPPTQAQSMVRRMSQVQGNHYVQQTLGRSSRSSSRTTAPIMPKLAVSEPDDAYEQEADQVADQVMRMAAPPSTPPASDGDENPTTPTRLNRYIHRHYVQTAPAAAGIQTTPDVESRVERLQQGGRPLPQQERDFFEPRMGVDLSNVRIHTGSEPEATSQDLSARAFTVGSHIAFNAGEYQPGTSGGRRLLAHELTHVVQQGAASPTQAHPEQEASQAEATPEDKVNRCETEVCRMEEVQLKTAGIQMSAEQDDFKVNRCATDVCRMNEAQLKTAGVQTATEQDNLKVNRCANDSCRMEESHLKAVQRQSLVGSMKSIQGQTTVNRCECTACRIDERHLKTAGVRRSIQRQSKVNRCATGACQMDEAKLKARLQRTSLNTTAKAVQRQPKVNRCATGACRMEEAQLKGALQRKPVENTAPSQIATLQQDTADMKADYAREMERKAMMDHRAAEVSTQDPAFPSKTKPLDQAPQSKQARDIAPAARARAAHRRQDKSAEFDALVETQTETMTSERTALAGAVATTHTASPSDAEKDTKMAPERAAEVPVQPAKGKSVPAVADTATATAQTPSAEAKSSGPAPVAKEETAPLPTTEGKVETDLSTAVRAQFNTPADGASGAPNFSQMSLPEAVLAMEAHAASMRNTAQAIVDEKKGTLQSASVVNSAASVVRTEAVAVAEPNAQSAPLFGAQADPGKVDAVAPEAMDAPSKPAPAVDALPDAAVPSQDMATPAVLATGTDKDSAATPPGITAPAASTMEPAAPAPSAEVPVQRSALPQVQRDGNPLESLIPDWAKSLLDGLRGDASAKKSELNGEKTAKSSELNTSEQQKESELQTDQGTKETELQGDQDAKDAELQADQDGKSAELQADQTTKESELQSDQTTKESELQADQTTKESELQTDQTTKESELQNDQETKGSELESDQAARAEELQSDAETKDGELQADVETKSQELESDFSQTEQEAEQKQTEAAQQVAGETTSLETQTQTTSTIVEQNWDALQNDAETQIGELDTEAQGICATQREEVMNFLDPSKPRSPEAKAEWERIKANAQRVWEDFLKRADPALKRLEALWNNAKTLAANLWQRLQNFAATLKSKVEGFINSAWEWIQEKYQWISERWANAEAWIADKADAARTWIADKADAARTWIADKADAARTWIAGKADAARTWIADKAGAANTWIGDKADGARTWIGDKATSARTVINDKATAAQTWISGKADAATTWFSTKGHAVVNTLSSKANSAANGLKNSGNRIVRWFGGIVSGLISGVESVAHSAVDTVSGVMNSALSRIEAKASSVVTFISQKATSVVSWVENKATSVVTTVENTATGAVNGVASLATSAVTTVEGAATNAVTEVETAATGAVNWVEDKATGAVNWVEDKATGAVNWVEGAATTAVNWLEQGATAVVQKINQLLDWLKAKWEEWKPVLEKTFADWMKKVEKLWEDVKQLASEAWQKLQEGWQILREFLINAIVLLSGCWQAFQHFLATFDFENWFLTQCDNIVRDKINQIIPGMPCNNGSSRGRIDLNGSISGPVGPIPGKAQGNMGLEVEQRGNGEVAFTYVKNAAAGVEVGAGGIAQVYAGEETYGAAAVAQAGAVAGVEQTETYVFDPNKTGELCQASTYLGLLATREAANAADIPGVPWALDQLLNPRRESRSASLFLNGAGEAQASGDMMPFVDNSTLGLTPLGALGRIDIEGNRALTFTETSNGYQVGVDLSGQLNVSGDLDAIVGDTNAQLTLGDGAGGALMFDKSGNLTGVGFTAEITVEGQVDMDTVLANLAKSQGWPSVPEIDVQGGGTYKLEFVNTNPAQLAILGYQIKTLNPDALQSLPVAVSNSGVEVSRITHGDELKYGGRLGIDELWEAEVDINGTLNQEMEERLFAFEDGQIKTGCEE